MIKKLFILSIFILGHLTARAQNLGFNLSLHGFADNREFSTAGFPAPTHFGLRAAPEIYIAHDTLHYIGAGVNLLTKFGSTKVIDNTSLVLYYRLKNNGWQFNIGSFPRQNLITQYPLSLLSDTLKYFRPNIQGMYSSYTQGRLHANMWIDWTGLQTAHNREQFLFGLSLAYNGPRIFANLYSYMYHNAKPALPLPTDHVEDNGAANINIGVNLQQGTPFSVLNLSAGTLLSFERMRDIGGWRTPAGFISNFNIAYRSLALNNTFYAGPGHNIVYGEPFYRFKHYNRAALSWQPIHFSNVQGGFNFAFHFHPGGIATQQSFNLYYNFNYSRHLSARP